MRCLSRLLLALALLSSHRSGRAAERWEMRFFYDKNDSSLAILDLQFPSTRTGVALGAITRERRSKTDPVVVVTSDGGRNWDLLPLKDRGRSLFFLNDRAGWLATEKGLLKTSDGGRSWLPVRLEGVRANPLRVFFLDESRGWLLCAEKQIYATRDGCRSWQILETSRQPDVAAAQSLYTWATFLSPRVGLLTGFSRPPDRPSRPEWMEPDLRPVGRRPTSAIVLHTIDAGENWNARLLPKFGQIVRARALTESAALVLVQHPDSLLVASEIMALDLKAFTGRTLYSDKDHWLTDLALLGTDRLLAVAIDQEGRTTPYPAIPSRVKVLQSSDTRRWSEMTVDYRAEAHRGILAVVDASNAWLATDTGMILALVRD